MSVNQLFIFRSNFNHKFPHLTLAEELKFLCGVYEGLLLTYWAKIRLAGISKLSSLSVCSRIYFLAIS